MEGPLEVDYIDRLRRLTLNDADLGKVSTCDDVEWLNPVLDPRTLALVRLGALVAVGGSVPSYAAHTDAAVDAGASVAEAVDVLVAVLAVVGRPRVVAAAPKLALALGFDTDDLDQ